MAVTLDPIDLFQHEPQKWLNVRDDRNRLERATVAELNDGRRVNVYANNFHRRRQQVSHGYGMQHYREHQAEGDVTHALAHLLLSFQSIRNNFRQGAIVADASGEQKIDVVFHAVVHDSRLQDALVNCLADATAAPNRVDRSEMVLVASLHNVATFQVHAQTCAVERLLDVVRGQGVSGVQAVDVASTN